MKKLSTKSNLANKVLDKIKSGQVKMRPEIYFILKTILLITGIIVVALFALYLTSFIIFALRASGVWYLPGFGFSGLRASFALLPWLLILASIFLIIVLEILVKHFSFTYRLPLIYLILCLIIFALLGSLLIDKTSLHPSFFNRAKERRLPVAGNLYRGFGMAKFNNAHRGIILEITANGFLMQTRSDERLTIVISADTRLLSKINFNKNDMVIVLGERNNNTVHALGIRLINDYFRPFPRRPQQPDMK